MPTFDFTAPDGKAYSVDGPDGATPEQAFKILQDHLGESAAPSVGIGEDLLGVAKSAPGRIAAGIAGLPADLAHLYAPNQSDPNPLGSQAIQKALGSDYQAQREPGRLLQKGVDFAPAMIGGPETLAMKLATRVAAPAIGSEIGGAIGGPWGELGGALIGGGVTTAAARKFQEMAAARNAAPALTAEKTLETGSKQFNDAHDMNMVVKPDFATNAADDMRSTLKSFDPETHKPVFAAADRLENLAKSAPGLPPTAVEMNEVESIRKQLVSLKQNMDPSIREAARRAIGSLQKSQMALTAADTLSGDAAAYRNLTSQAIENWAKGRQAQTVMGKIANADLNAATAGSGANSDNATRQSIKQLARMVNNTNTPVWKKLGMSDAVGAAIEKAAKGTVVGNTARYIGKGAPTGIVSAAGGLGIGGLAGGPAGAVALPAAGYIAKKIGDLSTKRAANAITSLILSESPLAAQVAAQLPPQLVLQFPPKTQQLLRSLQLTSPVISKQIGQPVSQAIGQPAPY